MMLIGGLTKLPGVGFMMIYLQVMYLSSAKNDQSAAGNEAPQNCGLAYSGLDQGQICVKQLSWKELPGSNGSRHIHTPIILRTPKLLKAPVPHVPIKIARVLLPPGAGDPGS